MELVATGGKQLTGLCFDGDGVLHCCGAADGRILRLEGSALVEVASTGGAPAALLFDGDNQLFVCDQARSALCVVKPPEGSGTAAAAAGEVTQIVGEYEGAPLKGPHSGVYDSAGQLFFTDPGAYGTTSILSPRGSCFVVTGGADQVLRPLAHECLASPTGIALSPSESAVYVCEQSSNRILRFTQKPPGVWHAAIFHQFAGRLGPTAIVCDHSRDGLLYVARPEAPDLSEHGVISVLSGEGALLREFSVPGPEITSLALSLDARHLYLAEATTNSIYRMLL